MQCVPAITPQRAMGILYMWKHDALFALGSVISESKIANDPVPGGASSNVYTDIVLYIYLE